MRACELDGAPPREHPPPPPSSRSLALTPRLTNRRRSEDAIRAYFASGGAAKPTPAPKQPRLPPPDEATFARWFPGLPLSRTARAPPRARVLCFANAGNAEDMWTSEGTGPRRAPSPLLVRARERARARACTPLVVF